MKISILGTPYEIIVKKYNEEEVFARKHIDGFCDGNVKQIVVCDLTTYEGWEHETEQAIAAAQKATLRHEIVHAFLNESGLMENTLQHNGGWAHCEEMVDWIAIQGLKIYAAWQKARAI